MVVVIHAFPSILLERFIFPDHLLTLDFVRAVSCALLEEMFRLSLCPFGAFLCFLGALRFVQYIMNSTI